MSATPILLIVALVIGAGLLAMFGDWYGTKLGKARVSILGMRPRRTASFVTVVTGIVIAGLSLALLLAVSEYARTALFEVDDLSRQVTELTRDKASLTGEVAEATKELTAEHKRLEEAQAGYNTALQRSKELTETLEGREARIEELSSLQAELSGQIETQSEHLEALAEDREKLIADIDEMGAKLDVQEQMLAEKKAQLEELDKDLKLKQTQLDNVMDASLEAVRLYREAKDKLEALKEGRLISLAGEEIERSVVQGSDPVESIRAQLVGLLVSASKKAEQRGAEKSENGRFVVLSKSAISPVADPRETGGRSFTENEIIEAVARQIGDKAQSVAVLLVTMSNTLEGEIVPVDFELFTNKHVFRAGEIIATTTIDGSGTKGEILAELQEFLSQRVRDAASQAGVIPVSGYAGEITYEELLEATDKIRAAGGSAEVEAKAGEETWSGDKLQVRLEVR